MKLTFAGTRGQIDARTPRHRMHTALVVSYRRRRVMIDCGEDWLGRSDAHKPHAIVLTHAHPDHAFGLRHGAPCPVHATPTTWSLIDDYPIDRRHTIRPRKLVEVCGIGFEAFEVEHSINCPAVCYRITAGRVTVLYAPDVLYIPERATAMAGIRLYIGDGATMSRSFVRRQDGRLIGHAPVRTQLTWCQKEGVGEAIITHCGSQIVTGDERRLGAQLRAWAGERGIEASFAHDGMERVLR